jgi:hypothetical protein
MLCSLCQVCLCVGVCAVVPAAVPHVVTRHGWVREEQHIRERAIAAASSCMQTHINASIQVKPSALRLKEVLPFNAVDKQSRVCQGTPLHSDLACRFPEACDIASFRHTSSAAYQRCESVTTYLRARLVVHRLLLLSLPGRR